MSALQKIKSAGFNVNLQGDSFEITPSSLLNSQQREFLKTHKAEIISELQYEELTVVIFTPAGNALVVEARNKEHADFLKRMNPPRSMQS